MGGVDDGADDVVVNAGVGEPALSARAELVERLSADKKQSGFEASNAVSSTALCAGVKASHEVDVDQQLGHLVDSSAALQCG